MDADAHTCQYGCTVNTQAYEYTNILVRIIGKNRYADRVRVYHISSMVCCISNATPCSTMMRTLLDRYMNFVETTAATARPISKHTCREQGGLSPIFKRQSAVVYAYKVFAIKVKNTFYFREKKRISSPS